MNQDPTRVRELVESSPHLDRVNFKAQELITDKFLEGAYPCLITGLADGWNTGTWTLDFLQDKYGHLRTKISKFDYATLKREEKSILIRDYIDYVIKNEEKNESVPFYNNTDFTTPEDLWDDYEVPTYFKCAFDNFRRSSNRDTLSWIYIAPTNSVTGLHTDVADTFAWNLVISGSKLWVFYSPDMEDFLCEGMINPFAPDLNKYPLFKKANPIVCIQRAGDIVFTPSPWSHAVLNIEMGVSITENFINKYDLEIVKQYCSDNNIDIPELQNLV